MRELFTRRTGKSFVAIIALTILALINPAYATDRAFEREIDLEGTTNTRDIGGYRTDDLRTVRWGQIIRSENLSRLTADDFRKLEELGVKTVVDLRTDREHAESPTAWLGDKPPQFHHFPVGDAGNDWFKAQHRLMKKARFTPEQSLEHMQEGYRMIADEGTDSYRKLMDLVLDPSNWPILVHCSAGKDRSGVAVALILEAVGVDRAVIMEDYLLTNEIGRSAQKAALLARESRKSARIGKGPSADAWLPIVGVHPDMLETFYASVDEQYGSMDAFLAELGVDRHARDSLRDSLTLARAEWAMEE